jgi:cyclopropane fatty-acyl-phospholipid synthase-like methyltransferase
MYMKRKVRAWLRTWIPKMISAFEPEGRKGKWFEEKYYTYLFTRNHHYSKAEPNKEEAERWDHIDRLLEQARKSSGQFSQIIDFGCGRGWLTQALQPYGKVTGLEPVLKVVEHGKKLYPGIDLKQGDLITLTGMKADLIVCSEVIEHVGSTRLPQYFTTFYEVLEEGGWLLVTTPRKEGYEAWSVFVQLDQPTEEWLSEDDVRELAEAAGFKSVAKQVYGARPMPSAPQIEIYQQWLFQKQHASFPG